MFNTPFNLDFLVFSNEQLLVWKFQVITKLVGSGGFKHVQHVRPNKGPTKRGPHKRSGKFLHAGNNGRALSERRVMSQKRSPVLGEN